MARGEILNRAVLRRDVSLTVSSTNEHIYGIVVKLNAVNRKMGAPIQIDGANHGTH